jgi:hypothetical protein
MTLNSRTHSFLSRARKQAVLTAILLLCVSQAACVRAPSVDVIGSFFPAWMVCVTAAIVATFVVRAILVRLRLESEVGPLGLFYPSLVVLLCCGLWLLFYR